MNGKNSLIVSAIFLAMVVPALQGSSFMLQWWSGYVSSFLSTIWNQLIGYAGLHLSPPVPAQQQFQNQLSSMQSRTGNFTNIYVSDAQQYASEFAKQGLNLNQSWSVQITDRNSTTSPVIGNLTVTWLGPSRSLSIVNGIRSYNVSPTYAVTLTHKAFMALSGDVVKSDIFSGIADYLTYNASRSISYRFVK